ncbi:response regulator [Altererythrobacter sp. MF3-039]|uniref:response regulator n=1 Tax=Altererythrobacter sp. MF3-039 TaxID=3252901 RepID=UPI00390C8AED
MARTRKSAKKSATAERVLVVEDDAILSLAYEEELRELGIKDIVVCATAEKALEALREGRPDVMILDVHLADRDDGWSLADLVDNIGPNTPHIIFSTGAPQDIPDRIKKLGDVLVKPVDMQELRKLVADTGTAKKGLMGRLRKSLA